MASIIKSCSINLNDNKTNILLLISKILLIDQILRYKRLTHRGVEQSGSSSGS